MGLVRMRLRAELAAVRGEQGCWRCPEELRARVVAYVEVRRGEGASFRKIGRELGISSTAVRRWLRREPGGGRGELVPVRVAGGAHAPGWSVGGVTVVSPRGWRVEGLDLEGVVALLEVLG